MGEVWKDIKGYEGLYQVSDLGRVKSFCRRLKNGHSVRRELILTPRVVGSKGLYYYDVVLHRSGYKKSFKVHRLVGVHFKDNPHGYRLINHLDEDTFNNKATNIEWSSSRENVTYSIKKIKSSRFTGVYKESRSGKWHAQITVDGKVKFLGLFDSEQNAGDSYQNALRSKGLVNKYSKV